MTKTTVAPERVDTVSRYTWQDLFTNTRHTRLYDEYPASPRFLPAAVWEEMAADFAECEDPIGGLLVWRKSLDEDFHHLFMFAGQTPAQERNVMRNASSLLSSAVRAGEWLTLQMAGETCLAWQLPNRYAKGWPDDHEAPEVDHFIKPLSGSVRG